MGICRDHRPRAQAPAVVYHAPSTVCTITLAAMGNNTTTDVVFIALKNLENLL